MPGATVVIRLAETVRGKRMRWWMAGIAAVRGTALAAPGARAGEWVQVSCANPSGSSAPSDGWSTSSSGPTFGIGDASAACTSQAPMFAELINGAAANPGTAETLEYTPPAGSSLVGGSAQVTLDGDGHDPSGASGIAALYEPALVVDANDQFYECASWNNPGCVSSTSSNQSVSPDHYAGPLAIPPNRGGDLFLNAWCDAIPNQNLSCDEGGARGYIARVTVSKADLLLSNSAAPQAGGFGGSALQPAARGTAHLVFTAQDPGGPGIYRVTARVDGKTVWAGTPDSNGGRCVSVGSDAPADALMFDWQQPCPRTEVVDVPIATAGLPDGRHELAVTVTDAARNSSTVLDEEISTSNPVLTPKPRNGHVVQARFLIRWHWHGTRTQVLKITVVHRAAAVRAQRPRLARR
jgi:hypothetical protein